ncbi:MAG: dihydropteroate synthase [Candidatus Omnitrophota bacterium]
MPIKEIKKHSCRSRFVLSARNFSIPLGDKTKIMGIMNITPDSFSRDGLLARNKGRLSAVAFAQKLIKEGADLLDIGGESSRPGARAISADEEIRRIIPTIQKLAKQNTIPISVDTYKPLVARHALDAGAGIVNNIMGITPDKNLLKMARNYDAVVILMHMKGTPRTMQKNIHYKNLIKEILAALKNSIENCLDIGIKSDRIVLDPGIGFAKTVRDNLEIIHRLAEFRKLKRPILIGTSRKSFIGQILNKEVNDRVLGTAATVCASILGGAHIVRVHDVAAMKEVASVTDAILNIDY